MLRELNENEMGMVSGGVGEAGIGLSVPGDRNGNGLDDMEEDGLISNGMWDGMASSITPGMRENYGVWEPGPSVGGVEEPMFDHDDICEIANVALVGVTAGAYGFAGAAMGSVVPGVGTLLGGAAGGVVGTVVGVVTWNGIDQDFGCP